MLMLSVVSRGYNPTSEALGFGGFQPPTDVRCGYQALDRSTGSEIYV
jgi:hypothetical protein